MSHEVYRYRIDRRVAFEEVEQSLLLAVLAAESLHGRERVRLEATYGSDPRRRRCEIGSTSEVGETIARMFTGFISMEFGTDAFAVERVRAADGDASAPAGCAVRQAS